MEFRSQEEPVRDMGASSTPPASSSGNGAPLPAGGAPLPAGAVRYHECLRNHAAALGGHVVDGCGEFMPGDDAALKCAACGCHRSFHRKDDRQLLQLPAPPVTPPTAPRVPLLMPPPPHPYNPHHHYAFPYQGTTPSGSGGTTTESSSEERGPPSSSAAQGQHQHQPARQKRFRTKFTPEQKDQMLAFADRLGWRMQKQDEALVDQFCAQVGVRRQVFKVWMHNNKHISRRQPQQEQQSQSQQQQQSQQP